MRALKGDEAKLIPGNSAQNVGLVHNFLPTPSDLCEPVNMDLQNDDVEEIETAWRITMRLELLRLLLFALLLETDFHITTYPLDSKPTETAEGLGCSRSKTAMKW